MSLVPVFTAFEAQYGFEPLPVFASVNYKGGVGKTTTGRILGQTLAEMPDFNKGKPILFIDMDPQCNTSKRFEAVQTLENGSKIPVDHPDLEGEEVPQSSICDLWLDKLYPGEGKKSVIPMPYETSNPLIHIVPAHEPQMARAMRVDEETAVQLGADMCNWLRTPRMAEKYCCAIIDTQPSKTNLIDAALRAATHVYIPFVPEPQSIDGIYSMISYLEAQDELRAGDVPLSLMGLLPNMVRRTSLHTGKLKALQDHPIFSKYLMPIKLVERVAYPETDDHRNRPDTVTSAKGSNIAVEAKKFSKHIIKKLYEGAPT